MRAKDLAEKYNRNSGTIIGKLKELGVHKSTVYRYTSDDIEYLRKYYPIGGYELVKDHFPKCTKSSIAGVCSKHKIKYQAFFDERWSQEEIDILKNNSGKCSMEELCNLLGGKRTKIAISSKIGEMGFDKIREHWSESEIQIIKDYYSTTPMEDIMKMLPNRTRSSIVSKAMSLNILGLRSTLTWWTEEQVEFLKNNYLDMNDGQLSEKLGKPRKSVLDKRVTMGLTRFGHFNNASYESLAKFIRGNIGGWKSASLKQCNYQCVLTGSKEYQIHHLYSFSRILNQTILEYDFKLKDSFKDYTQEELEFILKKFKINHDKYPLGICLRKDIHKMFHDIYGTFVNPSMWNDFKEKIEQGIYTINQ